MYFVPHPLSADTFVSAAVSVVFPWSTWPIVPTFTCGLVRSNFAFAIVQSRVCWGPSLHRAWSVGRRAFSLCAPRSTLHALRLHFTHNLFRFRLRYFLVMRVLNR